MPRLMSMAKTWKALTEGVAVEAWQLEMLCEKDRGISWEWSGGEIRVFKDVTRRSRFVADSEDFLPWVWQPAWQFLKPGDVIELIEWSQRVGLQWVCERCGIVTNDRMCYPWGVDRDHEGCSGKGQEVVKRGPRRGVLRKVVSVRKERLGDIDEVELAREGFHGKSKKWFIARYCEPGKPDPDRPVNRIELRELPC